jgi:hypothetical protein
MTFFTCIFEGPITYPETERCSYRGVGRSVNPIQTGGEIMLYTALLAPFPRIQKAISSSVTTPEFDILDSYQIVSFEGGYPEF